MRARLGKQTGQAEAEGKGEAGVGNQRRIWVRTDVGERQNGFQQADN